MEAGIMIQTGGLLAGTVSMANSEVSHSRWVHTRGAPEFSALPD